MTQLNISPNSTLMEYTALQATTPVLAVIVPCFNEEEALPATLEKLSGILTTLIAEMRISATSYIACVDDGSADATWELIAQFCARTRGKIRGLKLSRNFGHQNALLSGLHNFDYDIAVTIDADLQDPPEVITEMVAKYVDEGFDIVYGVRSDRSSDSSFKRGTAQGYYRLMRALGVNLVNDHADFRLLSRRVVEALSGFKEYHLFLRGIIPYIGFQSAVVYYARAARTAGTTKYPLHKMLAFAWEGITSFSVLPLSIITSCGVLVFIISLLLSVWALVMKLSAKTVPGWASIIIAHYLIDGLTILFIGIVGQYVGRIYMEVKERPRFIIEKKLMGNE